MMRKFINLLIVCLSVTTLFLSSCDNRYKSSLALIEAIEQEDQEQVSQLLEAGVDPNAPSAPILPKLNTFLDSFPRLPLSVACETGNLEIVELLIEHGAIATYVEEAGWSPLSSALFYYQPNDVAIITLLLQNGADVSLEESGETPVFRASRMIPKVFDASKSNGTVFSSEYDEETAKGIVEIVKKLIQPEDVNRQSIAGRTLLMNAASVGNVKLVQYLLSEQADPALQDTTGKTAYDYAVENGYTEIAELLK